MNVIELKDSDSSDNDLFIIKQIKPVNKITLPEALIIKYGVLNSFNSKKNKKKKKDKMKKRSTDSNEKQPKKIKVHSTIKTEGSQKQPSNSTSDMKNKNEEKHFKCKKNIFDFVKKIDKSNTEEVINLNVKVEKEVSYCEEEEESFNATDFSNRIEKRKADEFSPGTSRMKKKCDLGNTNIAPVTFKEIKFFNKLKNDTVFVNENSESDVNVFEVSNNELSSNVSRGSIVTKSVKPEKNLDVNKGSFVKSKLHSGEFFSFVEFKYQNNLDDKSMESMESTDKSMESTDKSMEKFIDNSELITFLLKKVISDETKKQIYLEKQSLKNGRIVEKLLSRNECRVLEKFFNLQDSACQVFVRMLGRKKDWHRISSINYKDIGDNLENEFGILSNENFVDINIENEDLKIQMQLLSRPEILKLCRAFNVFLKCNSTAKKEILINSLIEDSKKQKSILDILRKNSTSRLDLLKSEVKKYLGLCVRVNNQIFQVFHKILLLFSFAHYNDEEEKRFKNELFLYFQVYKNMVKFPNYVLSPTVVFETRSDFEEYEKSLSLQDTFEIAISNKDYEEFVSVFNKVKEEFKKLLKNHEYQQRYLNLKPFLRKFSAGTVYARILTKFCKTFKKKTDNLEIMATAQLLLNQDFFLLGKKGEWYEILSKALEMLKQNNAAAEVIIQSLNDPLINEVQKLTLQLRGQHILKKKSCGINDENLREVLDDICTPSVQEPPSIEIKGKALDGNESGFKSVYVQDFQNGKVFSSVEERALSYYKSIGFTKGYHTEGCIVQTMYFILFFDIIYGLSPEGVFQTPYQEAPLDMYSSSFYLNRKEDIDLLLNDMLVWDEKQIEMKIKSTYYKNYYANCVINWNDEFTPELFCEVIACITMPVLVLIFQKFTKNLRVARSGFPDLTLWNPGTKKCKFVEVKSPNDKLSPAQRIWLDYLRNIGLDCEVCNVKNISGRSCG